MEDTTNFQDFEEFEDTLSLCDLPLDNQEFEPEYICSPSNQDLFEFSIYPNPETDPKLDHIIFCGKMIPQKHDEPTILFTDQSRYLSPSNKNNRSQSLRVLSSNSKTSPSPETRSNRYHSSNSRKHKVLIGLAKVPSKMELSDIKKRQNRKRTPAPMIPALNSKEPAVSGGGSGCWGLLRPLRCRSHLASLFAKASLGCIPHV